MQFALLILKAISAELELCPLVHYIQLNTLWVFFIHVGVGITKFNEYQEIKKMKIFAFILQILFLNRRHISGRI